jgi:hypothetical protein
MDVLSYASDDYKAPDEDVIQRPRGKMSHRQWRLLGRELQAAVVPFSFWRSRLRKLLIKVDDWTIAIDESGEYPHLRARVLFGIADFPMRFELATGRSNTVEAWLDPSIRALQHLERLWVEPRFDARCSVFTSSPVTMLHLLDDPQLRAAIMVHPTFRLTCSHVGGMDDCFLLSLLPKPGGIDLASTATVRDLMHEFLRRLRVVGVATGIGIPWTLGV